MLTEADIQRIADCLVRGCRPVAVGVFGSYAVGFAKSASDLDLFVIQETKLPRAARRKAALRTLPHVMRPLDVHVFTPQEFELDAQDYLSFAWVIVRQARVFYVRQNSMSLVPSLNIASRVDHGV